MLRTAAASGFSIDWGAFGLVLAASLVAAVVIVAFFSVALRLLATGSSGAVTDDASAPAHRSPLATFGAVLCIAICVAAVLYGLYLVIPLFHQH